MVWKVRLMAPTDASSSTGRFAHEGWGAALVAAVCEHAKRAGARMVGLHSHQSRVDASRFHERHGFEVTGDDFIEQP